MNANSQGSSAALLAGPTAPGLDALIPAADLARLTGMPHESDLLEDLRVAVGTYTGFGADGPLIAEIVSQVVAAIVTAVLAERVPPDSRPGPQPETQVWGRDMSAAVQAWRDRATEGAPQHGGRPGIADVIRISPDRTPAWLTGGQICAIFAVDIVGFTRPDRDDDIRRYLHEKLYEFLRKAFDESGIPWEVCRSEDRGDGALVVVPPEISGKGLIDPLPERLRSLIRRHNHVSCPAARIQLRAATHIGLVEHDGHGFVGTDINFLFRMLEAQSLRRMLTARGAEVALIVSDYVYRTLVCRYPSQVSPEAFRRVRFQVKQTRAQAWMHIPGA